jgi:small GTP-binding protein
MNKFKINIGIFGCVSVGKSTFLNAISGRQFSDTEIKRTTMVPQVYTETESENGQITNATIIRRDNRYANETASNQIDIGKFTIKQCQPVYHQIDRICDLFDTSIIDPRIKIDIYDIPGLNDSTSKNIYYEWVSQNIHMFNIIIFMTDVTKGLNSSDEIDVLKLLLGSMTKSNAKMICLMNKCDDIYFDPEQNDLVFEEEEQEKIYIQATNILADLAKTFGFIMNKTDRITPFIPISSENCYIYRALKMNQNCILDPIHQNRLCKNECGANQWKKMTNLEKENLFNLVVTKLNETYQSKILDTGYITVKSIIQGIINKNKSEFMMHHIEEDMKKLIVNTIDDSLEYVKNVQEFDKQLKSLETLTGKTSYAVLWKNIMCSIDNYVASILKTNTRIINNRGAFNFESFDKIHSMMQSYCMTFRYLIEQLSLIKDYPYDFMRVKHMSLVSKLLDIYNQLNSIESEDYMHIVPENLKCYLQIIHTYAPDKFDHYAKIFLSFSIFDSKNKYISKNEKELMNLIEYINKHSAMTPVLVEQICSILIIKLSYTINWTISRSFDRNFDYLITLKRMINKTIKLSRDEFYYPLNVLLEIINKNISIGLGTNSLTNIYKPEIDYQKALSLLNHNIDYELDMTFEVKLLSIISGKN